MSLVHSLDSLLSPNPLCILFSQSVEPVITPCTEGCSSERHLHCSVQAKGPVLWSLSDMMTRNEFAALTPALCTLHKKKKKKETQIKIRVQKTGHFQHLNFMSLATTI